MRASLTLLALAVASTANAQTTSSLIAKLPSCALDCVLKYLPDTTCDVTDLSCICGTKELWTNATACILPACTVKEALTAQNISGQVCQVPVRDKSFETRIIAPGLGLLTIIFVIIRIIARRPLQSDIFGWDDGLIIASLVFAISEAVAHVLLGHFGLGQDVWHVPFDNITTTLKIFWFAEFPYLFSTTLTRISILVFYLRIFSDYRFQLVAKGLIYFNIAFCLAFFFPLVFQCVPVSYAWTRWTGEAGGKCINLNAGTWAHAAINMVLDFTVLLLPLPSLYSLQLTYTWWKRVRIMVMFSFGLIVTVISILRLQTLITFANTQNPTWDYFGAAIWSLIEADVAIICACLPMAKVFFTRVAPQWLGLSISASRHAPPPILAARRGWTGTMGSSESSHRYSKPAHMPGVTVSPIEEEESRLRGEFVQLEDYGSKHDKRRSSFCLPLQGSR